MFKLDSWQEIISTMRKNKLRTVLTGFSVFWGIFMLIILLGSGLGLENAARDSFSRGAINSVWIFPGRTSMSFQGMQPGRGLTFYDEDFEKTRDRNDEIIDITSRFSHYGTVVSYKNKTADYDVISARDADLGIEQMEVVTGRFINPKDLDERRKVAVISPVVRDYFFEDEDPIGKFVIYNGLAFKVVGVFKDNSELNHYRIYIPTTTAQALFNGRNTISAVAFTINDMSLSETEAFEDRIRNQFSRRHKFDPDDRSALSLTNNWENYNEVLKIFTGIKIFIWVIGILSIMASIVGVANIMLITVKERTKEIGVRKAIGATPGSVIRMVLFESVLITSFFGYIGLLLGTGLLELISRFIPPNEMIMNPGVNTSIAIGATLLLIICGTVAGFFPARKAAHIKPVVALRDE